jgi:hypothetical protein
MTIDVIIRILNNLLNRLKDAKIHAEANGDLAQVVELENKITETEASLARLNALE